MEVKKEKGNTDLAQDLNLERNRVLHVKKVLQMYPYTTLKRCAEMLGIGERTLSRIIKDNELYKYSFYLKRIKHFTITKKDGTSTATRVL